MKHPLHPALVHFPIACWTLATLADFGGRWWGEPAWQFAGGLLLVGAISALATMAAGFVELMKIPNDSPALRVANRHLLMALIAWSSYTASLMLRLHGKTLHPPDALALALSMIGFLALCVTGWLGGSLVYTHGVGVQREGSDESHARGLPPSHHKPG
ncbi:DUF2231 domain-containing protein [Pseudoxanthomonas sp. PXM04]|uniref:DUF2231 domain-containing protein n=1 Tax=Pseudoxanthomonas sp. PXM04 TaxID=2769297 RepID=UPI001780F340|nr:DUF2231 domain-containing protein [Pseudoxanthomonas sp. PXM04]MBD9378932.1 DUF2231 domain-containing protein [Pseudoxanthomonas sp. PXM04]